MAESKPKKTPIPTPKPKVFDVARPSQTAASPTSRPIILGHQTSMQKDPMVSPAEKQGDLVVSPEPAVDEKLEKPKKEITIQPVAEETSVPVAPIEPKEQEALEEPSLASEESSSQIVDDAKLEDSGASDDSTNGNNDDDPLVEDTTAVDAVVSGVNTKKERLEAEDKEAKLNAEIDALVASKKYYVKIRTPARKRELRWLLVLLVLALLAGAGWYFGLGPGTEMWNKTPETPATQSPQTSEKQTDTQTEPKTEEKLAVYSNKETGVSFTYPNTWKTETVKDTEYPSRDVITITSPAETIKTSDGDSGDVEAEVFLRSRIFVENTTDTKEYASDLVLMKNCTSEDILMQNSNLKLLYIDFIKQSPEVSQVSVSPDNCQAAGDAFTGNDQVQFSSKKNTYVIYSEYIFTEDYLKKIGTTDKEEISTAQATGVVIPKDTFKSGTNFQIFKETLKSFKEL